nr:subtilase [Lachnospiraceae bacterium]
LKWKKNKKATGYQIKYVVGSKTKTVKITKNKTLKKTIKKLKKNKTYKVYIRSYKKNSSGTYYSAWSSVKKVKIKK